MNTSRKAMEWLTSLSSVNLMLGCVLFKKLEKFNESCPFSKAARSSFFNENVYDKLYRSGSAPAHIYGTPKMHKFSPSDTFPKRGPIVSSIGTFNYDLARFLCDLLSSIVPDDYSCKDTFSFVFQIQNANLSVKFLVSYNVTSLFTNIPLQETIHIAINISIIIQI